jgi:hypothetical protein
MAFNIKSTLEAVQSHILSSGYAREIVSIGEPKQPPQGGDSSFRFAIFMDNVEVVETTLNTSIEKITVAIRIYRNMLAEPVDRVELQMAEAVSELGSSLMGDFSLGDTIRNIDFGQYGGGFTINWGYVELGGTMFRIADFTLPLIVDDSATLAP